MELKKIYVPDIDASPYADNTVTGKGYRITVITDRLFRVEIDADGAFLDTPSQRVWKRNCGKAEFEVSKRGASVKLRTDKAEWTFDTLTKTFKISLKDGEKIYRANSLSINAGNLKGTRRTLDGAVGTAKLENGIMSKRGISLFDDTRSLELGADGLLKKRTASKDKDVYIFAYGNKYAEALKDFYRLTGENPLLPRFALGNWWSRYHVYSDEEYLGLMKKFSSDGIPFSVATIDMDWHITDISKEYGSVWVGQRGWTGYTWNKNLFKDPEAFLKQLKSEGYKITLNLHPADGCRAFEDYYGAIADYTGADKEKKEPVVFDMTNPTFINAYFECLHHPLERMGVDFWWIDWQQGKKTAVDNLDPLWLLNHYHTLDNAKGGRRPLILSRYAGPGSHRYQIGFSGDTFVGWKMLDFMPYFTSVSSNIGFTWWSHDIGGHHFGKKDGELYLRWIQLGVFSPVLRLHSSNNRFLDKDPFKYRADIREGAKQYLRLRHRLIPYIYTMNYLNHTEGMPLCRPVYYQYTDKGFYKKKYKNMFLFGTELLVAPITVPAKRTAETGMSYTDVLLPHGVWTDIFTGYQYEGNGKNVRMYRSPEHIPVLAKTGAILVTDENAVNDTSNPEKLLIQVFAGADNSFTLYEDDGESEGYTKGAFAKTTMTISGTRKDFDFVIAAPKGDISPIPSARTYKVVLFNVTAASSVSVICGDKSGEAKTFREGNSTVVQINADDAKVGITIRVGGAEYYELNKKDFIFSVMEASETGVVKKAFLYKFYDKLKKYKKGGLYKILKESERIINIKDN
ncbi:MAG: glycoside hydrolase family 31 protein [Clostridiales bacterium]|jgi:alpha-glucosidase (family GH31 glycosyl hydrolase)|nr:glycoside hydrolase family 31 protein [Clostridiales bacterium]